MKLPGSGYRGLVVQLDWTSAPQGSSENETKEAQKPGEPGLSYPEGFLFTDKHVRNWNAALGSLHPCSPPVSSRRFPRRSRVLSPQAPCQA
jgi:hypothetical protein